MDDWLPNVVLAPEFFRPFTALVRGDFRRFTREEGGYLIGRYHGDRVEIEAFYHDVAADSSAGHVSLSTDAFAQAASRCRPESGQEVIGTWHLHPPGFGARYSGVDVDSLFIDRMVLNATDPDKYDAPWVHLIVPGIEVERLRAYTLDIASDVKLEAPSRALRPTEEIKLPKDCRFGLLVRPRRPGQTEFYPMSRRLWGAALRAGRLAGFWRSCRQGPACLRWERVFVENFVRKMHRSGPLGHAAVGQSFTYCRLVGDPASGPVRVHRHPFRLPAAAGTERFVPLAVHFPEATVSVVLQNPDLDEQAYTFEVSPRETISALMGRVKQAAGLATAPVLWTLLQAQAAAALRNRTRVDEFGKVYLPEDLTVGEVLARRETPEVPIYWQSPDLSPDAVRRLRTHRFAMMGYDVERLHRRHVVLAGLGLLGCGIGHLLGTMAVGRLTLVDNGVVDWVDVFRQSLYGPADVGNPKVHAAARQLAAMGPHCSPVQLEIPSVLVSDVQTALRALDTLAEAIREADLVIGALDSFSSRAALQVICRIHGVPFLAAALDHLPALSVTQGSIGLFPGGPGPCYGCGAGLKLQKDRGACTNAPIEFPGIVNSLAAKLAVEALQSDGALTPLSCRVYQDYRVEIQPLGKPADSCEVCRLARQGPQPDLSDWTDRLVSWLIS